MKKGVAIYLRKSRDEENEDKEVVLKRHESQLLDYCKRNNLIVTKIYREIVSGDTIENRPEMQKLLKNIALYDGVVCMEIERLSRGNQIDQVKILETFKNAGAKIYTLNKVYDLTNEDIDEEFIEFALFMSRREYKIIKRRMQRGKRQANKDGYFTGGVCPFGYSKERQGRGWVLVPNDNANHVIEIYKRYSCGYGLQEIADHLNSLGLKTPRDNMFTQQAVRRVLTNKVYLGYINTYKPTPVTYTGLHKPIIDIDLFNKCQDRLKSNQTKLQIDRTLKNPFASILYCGVCGHVMALNTTKEGYFLRCITPHCSTSGAPFETVETQVITELKDALKDFNYYVDNYETETANKKESISKELKALRSEITKRKNMIKKACEMLELGIYSKEKYLERSETLESEIDNIETRIAELESITFESEAARQAIPKIENVLNKYYSLSPAEKNKLLKAIIEKIDYFKTVKGKKGANNDDLLKLNIYLKI